MPSWLTTLGAGPHTVTVTAEGASKVTLLSKEGNPIDMTAAREGTHDDGIRNEKALRRQVPAAVFL